MDSPGFSSRFERPLAIGAGPVMGWYVQQNG